MLVGGTRWEHNEVDKGTLLALSSNERFSASTATCAPMLKWWIVLSRFPSKSSRRRSTAASRARFEADERAFIVGVQ